MAGDSTKSEIRWWLRSIVVPLSIVGVLVAWLGWRSSQHHTKLLPVRVLAYATHPRQALLKAEAAMRRREPVSIVVEVRPIGIPEAVNFVHTFDEFSLAFDRDVVQKVVLQHGESQRTALIELSGEGAHNYHVVANQHEEMGPGTSSPGNPGYSRFEGTGSIVLHNHAKYLVVVGGGTSFKDRISIREIN